MAKYIELIDKYKVVHSDDEDMPTSYTWVDNTGEIVRCRECKHRTETTPTKWHPCVDMAVDDDWFCADGERKVRE